MELPGKRGAVPSVRLRLLACLAWHLFAGAAAQSSSACGDLPQLSPGVSGSLASHRDFGSQNYAAGMNCSWTLKVPSGASVTVEMIDGRLASGDCLRMLRESDGAVQLEICGQAVGSQSATLTSDTRILLSCSAAQGAEGFNATFRLSECGSQTAVSDSAGRIFSHFGYGSQTHRSYFPNMACQWTIAQRPGFRLMLRVSTLLINSGDCLNVTEAAPIGGSSIQQCGSFYDLYAISRVFNSSVTVTFATDSASTVSSGFWIDYAFFTDSLCGSVQWSGDSSGFFVSHVGHPHIEYFDNMNCSWHIPLPAGMTMRYMIHDMSLDYKDSLKVLRSSDRLLVKTFESYVPYPFAFTSTDALDVEFNTGRKMYIADVDWYKGFYFAFEFFNGPVCSGSKTLVGDFGAISSHTTAGISPYTNNMSCHWYIAVSAGKAVQVSFSFVYLEPCCDKLHLYDGNSTASREIGVVTGFDSSVIFETTGRFLTAYFHTNDMNTYRGFTMRYKAMDVIPPDSTTPTTSTT